MLCRSVVPPAARSPLPWPPPPTVLAGAVGAALPGPLVSPWAGAPGAVESISSAFAVLVCAVVVPDVAVVVLLPRVHLAYSFAIAM